jgi:hypothetical protein
LFFILAKKELLLCKTKGTREKTCIIRLTNISQAKARKFNIILLDSATLGITEKTN